MEAADTRCTQETSHAFVDGLPLHANGAAAAGSVQEIVETVVTAATVVPGKMDPQRALVPTAFETVFFALR